MHPSTHCTVCPTPTTRTELSAAPFDSQYRLLSETTSPTRCKLIDKLFPPHSELLPSAPDIFPVENGFLPE